MDSRAKIPLTKNDLVFQRLGLIKDYISLLLNESKTDKVTLQNAL
jgi:hypothetical protein